MREGLVGYKEKPSYHESGAALGWGPERGISILGHGQHLVGKSPKQSGRS